MRAGLMTFVAQLALASANMLYAVAAMSDAELARTLKVFAGDKEIAIGAAEGARLAREVREMMSVCGPNSLQHRGNFGAPMDAASVSWKRVSAGSRLHVVFVESFVSLSWTGEQLPVSEVLIGLDESDRVGPLLSRGPGRAEAEHTRCAEVPTLEIMCTPTLGRHLSRDRLLQCADLRRDDKGRIVPEMPDIAPSCS